MKNKLLYIILIFCLISCDPKESFYLQYYQILFKNDTDTDIKLVYYSSGAGGVGVETDTIHIKPYTTTTTTEADLNWIYIFEIDIEDDLELITQRSVKYLFDESETIKFLEVYVEDELIKTWKGESAYLGGDINAPYNYDSWEIIKNDEVIRDYDYFYHGDLVFTITDEDLETNE